MKGKHEALIDLNIWQKIKRRIEQRSLAPLRRDTRPDFPLRGFIACACCDKPMTAAWSTGRSARYAYYFCMTKGCTEFRRSVGKEPLETAFEELLQSLRPTESLYGLMQDMLRDVWDARLRNVATAAEAIRAELKQAERKAAQVMERILAADSAMLVRAYEGQFRKLEEHKAMLVEKMRNAGKPRNTFEAT